jgi:chemotaxis protein MotB
VSAARRHKKHHHEEHENHERWLVSGYDMMTLLFAVFVVLFAISSTNVSKVKELTKSLQEAFSGPVLSGGQAMMDRGNQSHADKASPTPPLTSISPAEAVDNAMKGTDVKSAATASISEAAKRGAELAAREEESFQALKRKIDALVADAHLSDKVSTTVSERGLKVRLLTDKLLFSSGSAIVHPAAFPTLDSIGAIVAEEGRHPVVVEGHTDDRPIRTSQYPSNWQLSGGRAAAVVQRLIGAGVAPRRTSLSGYAAVHPVTGNETSAGRARNRRVEIILTRLHGADQSHGGDEK